jgi:sodium-dependent dicarboxylate transporter 2/3/5
MWLSNTATAMMMFPIALSVIKVVCDNRLDQKGASNFSLSVMLAIALAANLGGIATLIGTPPNVAYAAFIQKKYAYTISFSDWFMVCAPISVLLLGSLYLVMVKWLYPNGMKDDAATKALIQNEITALGPMTVAEKRVLVIFITTAILWMTKDMINQLGWIRLDDNMIALIGGISLFIFPAGIVAKETLLFGGGIALAGALEKAGLMEQMGQWFAQFAFNRLLLIFLVTFVALFVSEVMSNVAQVIVFAPVVSSLAEAAGMHPLLLGIPMTLAASCASMLPMGTPPNAIAFSSGYIKLKDMSRVGFVINIIAIVLITLFGWLVLPLVFGR